MSLSSASLLSAAQPDLVSEVRPIVLWVAGLAMVTVFCVYLVGKFRGTYRESDLEPSNLMTNFRELHSQGELTDEEYRNIKAKLATQMQEWIEKPNEREEADDS